MIQDDEWVCPRCGMRRYRFRACAHCALFEQNWATGTGAPAEAKVVDALTPRT